MLNQELLLSLEQSQRSYCSFGSETSIFLYVQLVSTKSNHLQSTTALKTGLAHRALWKLTSYLKDSYSLKLCMAFDTSGLLGMVTALFTCCVTRGTIIWSTYCKSWMFQLCDQMLQKQNGRSLKQKPEYKRRSALLTSMMKRIIQGARTAIRSHSVTKDVEALRHNLRNGPHRCFGDHSKCVSEFCKHKKEEMTGNYMI